MLHYPYYLADDENLQKRQENLVDFCFSHIHPAKEKQILDIGCGNGSQTFYIAEIIGFENIIGIDLNEANIENASKHYSSDKIIFMIDDAQKLSTVKSYSVDIVVCIESAFHYPNKEAFLQAVHRILKPEGQLIIADILTKSYRKGPLLRNWKKKMHYNHWTMEDYLGTMEKLGFEIQIKEDITSSIIKGYEGYISWLDKANNMRWNQLLVAKGFLHMQVILNVILLKRRRTYCLFVCRKATVKPTIFS